MRAQNWGSVGTVRMRPRAEAEIPTIQIGRLLKVPKIQFDRMLEQPARKMPGAAR